MTFFTESTIEGGNVARWDAAFEMRLEAAQGGAGWAGDIGAEPR